MTRPPLIPERLVSFLVPPEDRDDLLGDLHERFLHLRASSSGLRASAWYWFQAFRCLPRLVWFRISLRNRSLSNRRTVSMKPSQTFSLVALLTDVRHGVRILIREPGFSATAALILALGVGATTTMFSISHAILRDLPLEDGERLVSVDRSNVEIGRTKMGLTPEGFSRIQAEQTVLEGLAAWDESTWQLAGFEGRPRRVSGAAVSPQTFELLRVQPILGRGLVDSDSEAGAAPVVVVGEDLWQDHLGGTQDILGTVLRVAGIQRTVVGVMPGWFGFPENQELWTPLSIDLTLDPAEVGTFRTVGRLRDGVSFDAAAAELVGIGHRVTSADPDRDPNVTYTVRPLADQYVDPSGRIMMHTMVVVVSFVLLIAAANVANLLLSRAVVRNKQVAIRMALGGGRWRVVRLLLIESLGLALLGGMGGLVLSWIGIGWFDRILGPQVDTWWIQFRVDGTALAFTAACVAGATVLAGIVPALQASGVDLQDAIKSESAGTTGFRQGRISAALVVGQLTLSCALLILASLMVRGVTRLESTEYGFEPAGVLTGRVDLEAFDYPEKANQRAFAQEFLARLKEIPGAAEVALFSRQPGVDANSIPYRLEADVDGQGERRLAVEQRWVSEEFFDFFRMPLREGRLFSAQDQEAGERVVVVNEAMANRLAPDGSAVGLRLFLGLTPSPDDGVRVIGVVEDPGVSVRQGAHFAGIYQPFWDTPYRTIRLSVRAQGEMAGMVTSIREVLGTLDPNIPFHGVGTVQGALDEAHLPERVFAILFGIFGAAALVLAVVGLYGVMAFSVNRRARELSVRRAVGASPEEILWTTFRDGLLPLGLGLVLGLGLAWLIAPLLGEALFGSDPRDPLVFSLVPLLLTTAATVGLWIPSRRASRADPMVALRTE